MTTAQAVMAAIVILMSLRILVARDLYAQMLYLNVVGFGLAGLVAATWRTDMGLIAAMCVFIFSTLESNAVSYTIRKVEEIRRAGGSD
ncbi:DUF2109 domain-containing protein [Methanopyrus sp.]